MECFKDDPGLLMKALEQVNESGNEPAERVDETPKSEESVDRTPDSNPKKDDQ